MANRRKKKQTGRKKNTVRKKQTPKNAKQVRSRPKSKSKSNNENENEMRELIDNHGSQLEDTREFSGDDTDHAVDNDNEGDILTVEGDDDNREQYETPRSSPKKTRNSLKDELSDGNDEEDDGNDEADDGNDEEDDESGNNKEKRRIVEVIDSDESESVRDAGEYTTDEYEQYTPNRTPSVELMKIHETGEPPKKRYKKELLSKKKSIVSKNSV